ncbi:MAG: VOC family protein [Luteolibacter sp.]
MSTFTEKDYPALVPYLVVQGAAKAIEFYKTAFGAQERYRLCATGSDTIGHAELSIRGHVIMLADEMPGRNTSPTTLKGTATTFCLMVADADEAFARAVAAGATVIMPPCDMFYGYRMAMVSDPFGHQWMIQHQLRAVSVEEMQKSWNEMSGQCPQSEQD